jgi:arylsulfatase A-like enzyme
MSRPLRVRRLALALSLAAACDRSGSSRAEGSRPNVLILSIDTLRADHLGCYGYERAGGPVSPAIDSFAREALLFERCFAPRGQTGPSLTSMLTGCYPSRHGVLDNFQPLGADVATIARRFAAAGYSAHAFLSFFPIPKASKAALGFEGSFFEAKPRMPEAPQSRWDDAAEQELVRFLRAPRESGRPFLAWAHFYDVHQPYVAPPPFAGRFSAGHRGPFALPEHAGEAAFDATVKAALDRAMVARAPVDAAEAAYVVALYDEGIAAADARIGRVLAALEESGLAGSTIVVITADHGEELGDHGGFWFHGNSVYDSVLRIPLLVRGPGVAAGRFGELVQNVDLLPTLLGFAGLPVPASPAEIDGLSFAAELRGARVDARRRAIAWSEWQHLILGARTDRWKLVFNPRGAHPKKPPYDTKDDDGFAIRCRELYEVAADPRETRDLWRERRGEVAPLRELVAAEYARRFAGLRPEAATIDDPAEKERLLALGYTEGGAGDYRLDPKSCEDDE